MNKIIKSIFLLVAIISLTACGLVNRTEITELPIVDVTYKEFKINATFDSLLTEFFKAYPNDNYEIYADGYNTDYITLVAMPEGNTLYPFAPLHYWHRKGKRIAVYQGIERFYKT